MDRLLLPWLGGVIGLLFDLLMPRRRDTQNLDWCVTFDLAANGNGWQPVEPTTHYQAGAGFVPTGDGTRWGAWYTLPGPMKVRSIKVEGLQDGGWVGIDVAVEGRYQVLYAAEPKKGAVHWRGFSPEITHVRVNPGRLNVPTLGAITRVTLAGHSPNVFGSSNCD